MADCRWQKKFVTDNAKRASCLPVFENVWQSQVNFACLFASQELPSSAQLPGEAGGVRLRMEVCCFTPNSSLHKIGVFENLWSHGFGMSGEQTLLILACKKFQIRVFWGPGTCGGPGCLGILVARLLLLLLPDFLSCYDICSYRPTDRR